MKFGFIGVGNMASSIIVGALRRGMMVAEDIYVYDVNPDAHLNIKKVFNISPCKTPEVLCTQSDIVFLCVKPNVMGSVAKKITPFLNENKSVVSIAAGYSHAMLSEIFPKDTHILRIMPNTPAITGCGMTVFEKPHNLSSPHYSCVYTIFESLGKCLELEDKYMHAVTALSGSGPAFAYMFIDALKLAGVHQGLNTRDALQLAAQTVKGAAEMVLSLGSHPEELCNKVCSPGGTTIEGVYALNKCGFKGNVMEAVIASSEKAKNL